MPQCLISPLPRVLFLCWVAFLPCPCVTVSHTMSGATSFQISNVSLPQGAEITLLIQLGRIRLQGRIALVLASPWAGLPPSDYLLMADIYCLYTGCRLYPVPPPSAGKAAIFVVIMSLRKTLVQGALPVASPSITKLWWHCRKLMSCMTDHIVLFESFPAFLLVLGSRRTCIACLD